MQQWIQKWRKRLSKEESLFAGKARLPRLRRRDRLARAMQWLLPNTRRNDVRFICTLFSASLIPLAFWLFPEKIAAIIAHVRDVLARDGANDSMRLFTGR